MLRLSVFLTITIQCLIRLAIFSQTGPLRCLVPLRCFGVKFLSSGQIDAFSNSGTNPKLLQYLLFWKLKRLYRVFCCCFYWKEHFYSFGLYVPWMSQQHVVICKKYVIYGRHRLDGLVFDVSVFSCGKVRFRVGQIKTGCHRFATGATLYCFFCCKSRRWFTRLLISPNWY